MRKRSLISSALIITFMLSLFPIAHAAGVNRTAYLRAGNALTALGYENEFDEGSLMLNTKITRIKFIDLIIKIIMPKGGTLKNNYYYSDVPMSSNRYPNLAAAAELGLVDYHEGLAFRPEDRVKYEEAAKIIVSAMQYTPMANAAGGWAAGYINTAESLGINKDVANRNEDFSYGDALLMLYNMLNASAPLYEINAGEISVKYDKRSDTSIMSLYDNVEKIYGVVSANEMSSLKSDRGTNHPGEIEITDKYGEKYLFDAPGYEDLIGYNVYALYKNEDNENYNDGTVLYIEKYRNEELVIDGKTIEEYNADTNSIIYENIIYNEDGTERSSKEKREGIPLSIDVLYNGQFAENMTDALGMINKDDTIDTRSVTFIDNDHDGKYDVLSIVASRTVIFNNVSVSRDIETVTDYFASKPVTIDLSGDTMWLEMKNEIMEEITSATVYSKGAVMTVYESLGEKPKVKIIFSDKKLIGTPSALGEDEIKIEKSQTSPLGTASSNMMWDTEDYGFRDVSYKLSKSAYKRMKGTVLFSIYDFKFDYMGELVCAIPYSYNRINQPTNTYADILGDRKFGVVSRAGLDDSGEKLFIRMFTKLPRSQGYTMESFVTADEFKFDDERVRTVDGTDWNSILKGNPITYTVDNNGEITRINTALAQRKNGKMAYITAPKKNELYFAKPNVRMFIGLDDQTKQIAYNKETEVIVVPDDTVEGSQKRETIFREAVQVHHIINDYRYRAVGLTFNEESIAADIVLLYANENEDIMTRPIVIVSDVSQGLNSKGEPCTIISGMASGVKVTYTSDDESFKDGRGRTLDINPGDILKLYLDFAYDCFAADLVYSFKDDKIVTTQENFSSNFGTGYAISNNYGSNASMNFGYMWNVDFQHLQLIESGKRPFAENAITIGAGSQNVIYVFDCASKKDPLRTGSLSDAITYMKGGNTCSRVAVKSNYGEITQSSGMIVIYNNWQKYRNVSDIIG